MSNLKTRLNKLEKRSGAAHTINEWTREDEDMLAYLRSIPSNCPNCEDCPNPDECLAIDKRLNVLRSLNDDYKAGYPFLERLQLI